MRTFILALAAATALAGTAQAATVYSNNFDSENGGNTALNYTGFAGLTVSGNVDLTRSGDFYACAGAGGACVDLDGTTGPGRLTSTASYSFAANQKVTLSFDLAGNQRNASIDGYVAGFEFGGLTTIDNYSIGFSGAPFNIGSFTTTGISTTTGIFGTEGFATRSLSFTTTGAGSLRFFIGTSSADNVGPVLDNVSLSVAGVPEPATWALMILGMGAVGGAMRRRTARLALA